MKYTNFSKLVNQYHFAIGNRFRYTNLCSNNDEQIVGHDVYRGLLICKSIKYEVYLVHNIQDVADDIRRNAANHWVQIDEHRKDVKL